MPQQSPKAVFRNTLIVVAVLAVIAVLWFAHQVFLLLFAGLLFGVFIRSIASWISRHLHFAMSWAITVTILTLLVVAVVLTASLAPGVSAQIHELRHTLPASLEQLQGYLQQYAWGVDLLNAMPTVSDITSADTSSVFYNLTGAISRTFEIVVNLAVVIFTGLFLASEPELYVNGFVRLWPKHAHTEIRSVIRDVHTSLQGWLLGTLADMAVIATLTFIALEIIGIPLALTLALLTGVLNFIPNLGAILSAVLPALLGLMQSPGTALTVIISYFGIQFLESHIVTPIIQKHASSVPPILAITAQLTFGILFGFMGLLLAVPLMATIMVLVDRLWVRRNDIAVGVVESVP